jgi:CheY-like chemotaxis protein
MAMSQAKADKPNKKILCVEDYEDICALITRVLDAYEVIGAYSKAIALKKAMEQQFDLYLLDYHLPDGTGLELCHLIRAFDPRTPILFCTGTKSLTDHQVREVGAQGYINKSDKLVETLERVVPEILGDKK